MKVDIVQKLSESLNEEKWTRATLNNYIIKNFSDLDSIIENAKKSAERNVNAYLKQKGLS